MSLCQQYSSKKVWVADSLWVRSSFDDQDLEGLLHGSRVRHRGGIRRGRKPEIAMILTRKRANSVGVEGSSNSGSTLGYSDESDGCSSSNALGSSQVGALTLLVREDGVDGEGKPAAVAAAVITFMMAMLSCPLAPCLPPTHVHLSRLPIGTGHSVVLDALRREWAGHSFDIKLHVYQRTKHVSGVAAITPGLIPEDLEALRSRPDHLFLPLADSGDKMIVEESKRDRDSKLWARYRTLVLQGLGIDVRDAPPLTVTTPLSCKSPIIYLRVMADRTQSNGLLTYVSDIKEEGLLYLLDRFPLSDGRSLSDCVRLIAPDKSTNRQHMHRSHFGRAYFLECVDAASAGEAMQAVQADSIQVVESMQFSIHAEIKKGGVGGGRLFEQDAAKRQLVEKRLALAKAAVDELHHTTCRCTLAARHTVAMHSLFTFRGGRPMYNSVNLSDRAPCASDVTSHIDSLCDDIIPSDMLSVASEADSMCGTFSFSSRKSVPGGWRPDSLPTQQTAPKLYSNQPYTAGYGFPRNRGWWQQNQQGQHYGDVLEFYPHSARQNLCWDSCYPGDQLPAYYYYPF